MSEPSVTERMAIEFATAVYKDIDVSDLGGWYSGKTIPCWVNFPGYHDKLSESQANEKKTGMRSFEFERWMVSRALNIPLDTVGSFDDSKLLYLSGKVVEKIREHQDEIKN